MVPAAGNMRVTLIHNPGAGEGDGRSRDLVAMLEGQGYCVLAQSSRDDGWEAVLDEPADVVAVAGGDGTVARVARRLVGRGVPIAPLPSGTANNISRTLGLVGRPFEDLVRGWARGRRVKLDVGIARGPWGERRFVEGVGLGLFACLLSRDPSEAPPAFDRREEKVAWALRKLQERSTSCSTIRIRGTLDGEDLSGSYVMLEAMNLQHVGPSLFLAPDSRPGDGQLDVVLVTEAERGRLSEYLARWQENPERLAVLPTRKGSRLELEWTGYEVHVDDVLWPAPHDEPPPPPGRIEVRLEGSAVEFLAPA